MEGREVVSDYRTPRELAEEIRRMAYLDEEFTDDFTSAIAAWGIALLDEVESAGYADKISGRQGYQGAINRRRDELQKEAGE
jgi:hypothetical protein